MRRDGYPFNFNGNACLTCAGNCCIGESGYIWINRSEMRALANHLDLSISVFMERYIEKVGDRYSLNEIRVSRDNYICAFFDLEKRACTIYGFRPMQCRTFPFWTRFKRYPKEVQKECPGIELDNPKSLDL